MGVKRQIGFLLLLIILSTVFTGRAYAKDIKSSDLINNAVEYDGREITYSGEVIGDIMRRGDYAWINVSDGDNAIGIWIPYTDAQKIRYTGSYAYKGDIIRVSGIFNRACAGHGGDFDIHSMNVEILQQGSETVRPADSLQIFMAAGLLLISAALGVVIYKRHV